MSEATARATILIVDDTPGSLELLVSVLGTDYRTIVARDGEQALRRLAEGLRPDLVLLDVRMPGLSGYEVCRRLKADPATRDIPVIFVTALDDVDDEAQGLALGAVDYLSKPVIPPIVHARVRTHLALAAQARTLQDMVSTLEQRSRELSELNRTLEQRVAQGVAELERVNRFKRYFSPALVDMILSGAADDPLRSHRQEVTAVALDLRGFTAFTEASEPDAVMGVLREYHAAMGALIMQYGGTLEHFAGDGMMVYFNDPVPVAQPATVAVHMALAMQQRFHELLADWRARGFALSMGIGVAHGVATIGGIGFEGRRDYAVVGTVANLASRLCAESSDGQVLVSEAVRDQVAGAVPMQALEPRGLKGFQRPVPIFLASRPAVIPPA